MSDNAMDRMISKMSKTKLIISQISNQNNNNIGIHNNIELKVKE